MDKNDQTKEALQKLCKALKTQVDLKSEEGELKLKEETQKRIDATTSFQTVITDLSTLVEKHNMHNKTIALRTLQTRNVRYKHQGGRHEL